MANNIEIKELLDAGVHSSHLMRKRNPNMAPYICMERNGIHVVNLYKTAVKIEEAAEALKKIVASGKKVPFVATKKQVKDVVAEKVTSVKTPYITERWPDSMLTNFVTIRKIVKKMSSIDKTKKDDIFDTLLKREKLHVKRSGEEPEKSLGSIVDTSRLPGALFVVDTLCEHIAVKEAQRLNIPILAMIDTNSDPREVDFAIPVNDDASKPIDKVLPYITKAVNEGLANRTATAEKETNE